MGSFDRRYEIDALLAAIVGSSDDAIISKDLNGIVTSWNQGAERMFGYTAEEMIGHPIAIIAAPDRPDEMPDILARIRSGERVDHYETLRKAKDGRLVEISLTVSPILDSQGRVAGASKIARDITERKRIEKEMAANAAELAKSNAELQQFAYLASHDLQEPFRTVSAFSEIIKRRYRGRLDQDADEFIDHVVAAAKRMSEMIYAFLEYSRAGKDQFAVESADLRACAQRAVMNIEQSIAEAEARVEIGELPSVAGHEASLAMVFQNLIANAIRYRRPEEPPRIAIQARQDGAFWEVSVSDNGIGIEPRHTERIFGLFRRLNPQYPGTGIGLSLCRKVVERHGGRIWAEGEPGVGSTFIFTLPVE